MSLCQVAQYCHWHQTEAIKFFLMWAWARNLAYFRKKMKAHSFKGTWFSAGTAIAFVLSMRSAQALPISHIYVPRRPSLTLTMLLLHHTNEVCAVLPSQSSVAVHEGTCEPSCSSLIEANGKFIPIFHSQMPFSVESGLHLKVLVNITLFCSLLCNEIVHVQLFGRCGFGGRKGGREAVELNCFP